MKVLLGKQVEVLHHCLVNQVNMKDLLGKAHKTMHLQIGKTDLSGLTEIVNGPDSLITFKADANNTPLPGLNH